MAAIPTNQPTFHSFIFTFFIPFHTKAPQREITTVSTSFFFLSLLGVMREGMTPLSTLRMHSFTARRLALSKHEERKGSSSHLCFPLSRRRMETTHLTLLRRSPNGQFSFLSRRYQFQWYLSLLNHSRWVNLIFSGWDRQIIVASGNDDIYLAFFSNLLFCIPCTQTDIHS